MISISPRKLPTILSLRVNQQNHKTDGSFAVRFSIEKGLPLGQAFYSLAQCRIGFILMQFVEGSLHLRFVCFVRNAKPL